jgi:integrase
MFSGDYGEDKLYNLTITEIQEWVFDDDWMPRTQISYRTKLYQLWEYALDKTWVDSNIIAKIPVPKVDDTAIKVLTVNQAKAMLVNANDFGLLPYVAIGLFCGIRSSEMLSMNGNHVDFANGVVHVPANVAKGRQKRTVIIQPALTIWLEPCKKDLAKGQPLVENFRKSFDDLREAAKITDWPTNGLRHSFASYYLAKFRNVPDTAYQMGNSPEVIKRHYDAVVLPAEAEKFWNLRP